MSVVAVAVGSEGIAVTTDSRTTVRREERDAIHHRVASDTAEKLYIAEDRFAVATYGIATIDGRTIRDLVEEFVPPPAAEIEQYAKALGAFFYENLREATPAPRREVRAEDFRWPLGFVVAGYDDDDIGRVLDVQVRPSDSKVKTTDLTTRNPGATSRGQHDAIERLLAGVDWEGIKRGGIKVPDELVEKLLLLRYDIIAPTTVEDAAKLSEFLVETQVRAQRFNDGTFLKPKLVPGCGGEIRTVAITKAGARWARNPGTAVLSPPRPHVTRRQGGEVDAPVRRSA